MRKSSIGVLATLAAIGASAWLAACDSSNTGQGEGLGGTFTATSGLVLDYSADIRRDSANPNLYHYAAAVRSRGVEVFTYQYTRERTQNGTNDTDQAATLNGEAVSGDEDLGLKQVTAFVASAEGQALQELLAAIRADGEQGSSAAGQLLLEAESLYAAGCTEPADDSIEKSCYCANGGLYCSCTKTQCCHWFIICVGYCPYQTQCYQGVCG